MDTTTTALIIIVVVGFIASFFVDTFVTQKQHPFQAAFLVAAYFLDVAAFVPQMIENSTKKGATDDISPIFLILVTCSFLMRLPAQKKMLKTARETDENIGITIIQTGGIFVPIIFYVIWQFQCGILSEPNNTRKTLLFWSGIVFSGLAVFFFYWTFVPKKRYMWNKDRLISASVL